MHVHSSINRAWETWVTRAHTDWATYQLHCSLMAPTKISQGQEGIQPALSYSEADYLLSIMLFFYTPWLLPLPFAVEIKTFKCSLREKMEIFPFCLLIKYLMLRLFHCWIKKKKSRARVGHRHEGDAELGLFACSQSCGRLHYCSHPSPLLSVRGRCFPVCEHVTCHGPCATSVCSHLIDARPIHVTWFKKTAQQQARWVLQKFQDPFLSFSWKSMRPQPKTCGAQPSSDVANLCGCKLLGLLRLLLRHRWLNLSSL